jgi:hypothetical protein
MLVSTRCLGQFKEPDEREIKLVKDQNIDTVVLLRLPSPHSSINKLLKGIGDVNYFSIEYLFYKKEGGTFAKQIVDYCNEDCSKRKASVSHESKNS